MTPIPPLDPFVQHAGRFLENPPPEPGVRWAEVEDSRRADGVALHLVSDQGAIWSRYSARCVRPSVVMDRSVGRRVLLRCEGRSLSRRVHVLVASAFVPMPAYVQALKPSQRVVLFLDGDDTHAAASNLRWASLREVRRRDALTYAAATRRAWRTGRKTAPLMGHQR